MNTIQGMSVKDVCRIIYEMATDNCCTCKLFNGRDTYAVYYFDGKLNESDRIGKPTKS